MIIDKRKYSIIIVWKVMEKVMQSQGISKVQKSTNSVKYTLYKASDFLEGCDFAEST